MNECTDADICGKNVDCTNINGGYSCACQTGYASGSNAADVKISKDCVGKGNLTFTKLAFANFVGNVPINHNINLFSLREFTIT